MRPHDTRHKQWTRKRLAWSELPCPDPAYTLAKVSVRSTRSGGAMALLRAGVDSDRIHLIGRWRSDEMHRYLHIQAPFLYGCIRSTDCCGMGVLTYGRTEYCLPLLHLRTQHVSICADVDVRTLTLHIQDSKLNANPHVTLSNFDDAHKYGRKQHLSDILRAGRAYGNSKIRSTTLFKNRKHDSIQYLHDSTSNLINWLRYYVVLVIYVNTYIPHTVDTERYFLHTLPSSNIHRVHLHSQKFTRFK